MDFQKLISKFIYKKDFKIIKEDLTQTELREKTQAENREPEEISKRSDIRRAARKMDYESGKDF